ncbi:Muscle-specific protein 20 [Armadillidium vulgare]|nr:Muscle-specific protein 20 [Armadillidium vulgare]
MFYKHRRQLIHNGDEIKLGRKHNFKLSHPPPFHIGLKQFVVTMRYTFQQSFDPNTVNMFRRPDPGKEKECLEWISTVLREQFPQGVPLRKILQDGQVLCRVINKLAPGSVKKIHSSVEFKFMENINKKYGVPNTDLFQTVDLWEGKDFHNVIATLYALGRTKDKYNL